MGMFLDLWRGGQILAGNMTRSDFDKHSITNTIHPYCQRVHRLAPLHLEIITQ